jgi:predicted permease
MRLETIGQDIKYAIRGLRSRPGFTAAVVTTLALGIGANAAMFGIVDRLLFRPPSLMKDPSTAHIVYTYQTNRGTERPSQVSRYVRYTDLTKWTTSFASTAGYAQRPLAVGIGESAREMSVGIVSATFFGFFDAPPALGRYFNTSEDQPPAGAPVAVLGYGFWQVNYNGRADVLGSKIQIGPTIYTIIGVAAPRFVGLWADRPPVAFIPITAYAGGTRPNFSNVAWWNTYSWGWMSMMARRKPGVSVEQANADLTQAMQKSYQAQMVEQTRSSPIALAKPRAIIGSILQARGPQASSVSKVATWVGGVSIIVLLISCANVANLLLARALRRRREIALRLALGVSRGRLLSQLFTESLLLALLGGAAGIFVAHWGGALLSAKLSIKTEAATGIHDLRTVMFAFAVAVGVGLLTGLAPVFQSRRVDLTSDLKAGSREGTYGRSRARVALLVVQGALSVILLVGAGLFVRSLSNVRSVRLGYDVDPVMLVDLNMRGAKLDSAQTVDLRSRLLAAAKTVAGVKTASLQASTPFWGTWNLSLYVEGIDTVGKFGNFDLNPVSSEYFATLGTRIIRGRGISDEDTPRTQPVAVVSENMGKVLWPGRDPIGQCFRIGADTVPCTYVVGIAENIKEQSLAADSGYYYYLPWQQFNPTSGGLFVRANGDATRYVEAVRRRLQREMPGASYLTITPFADIIGGVTASWELGATMFVAFGVLALVLAAIGLYSVIAYNVAQRTHELGVRVALGARGPDVIRLVVADGLKVAVVGVGIGVIVALWAGRWVKALLFDVSANDPFVFVIVAVTLLVVATAASWIPALRASRVDPNVALRTD